jgi:hypothetical protein
MADLPKDFLRCLAKGREWLVAHPDDKFCKNFGIKSHHLTPAKVSNVVPIIKISNLGESHVGYYFSVVRHPATYIMEQRWKIYFDGTLVLDHEKPLSRNGRHIKHQGRFIHKDDLWRAERVSP